MSQVIKITLPDGSEKTFPSGTSCMDIAHSISPQLATKVYAGMVNGKTQDATIPLTQDSNVLLLTWKDEEAKSVFWHSSAHLMAEAIQHFFPNVKFAIGPPIENGFYYDIDLGGTKLSEQDIDQIEKKMVELAKQKNAYVRTAVSKQDAIAYFQQKNDPYKLELIDGLQDGTITFYQQGNFTDLCRGPHLPHTGYIQAAKILNIAGAYWRGDETKPMLTRVYAITFPSKKELDEYILAYEEAKKRDHRKLGKELELFSFSENVGMGLPLWLPKGTAIREQLQQFLHKEQRKAGYQSVMTPHIGHKKLYVTSGHYEKYGKDSFQPISTPQEGEEFLLKPMNCPHHCEIYKSSPRSYKDLPLRLAEFGTVYRYEQHGELHGLTRVRGFTQDDAHIFCTPDQIKQEFVKVIDLVVEIFSLLKFDDFTAQISLRDKEDRSKYIGDNETWERAENDIIEATKTKNIKTVIAYGEAAFYGPKLDFMVRDALKRKWQLGTIQVDYTLPNRFELEYTDSDGSKKRPVMIHRAPFGSMERFLAILLENFAGNLPLWLSPKQVAILPLSDAYTDYAMSICQQLEELDIRAEVDTRAEKMGKKIRDAEVNKIPYMIIVGEKEKEQRTGSLRKHKHGDIGVFSIAEIIDRLKTEITQKVAE